MTAITAPRTAGARTAGSDALLVAKRNLIRLMRQPQLIVFSFVQPIMFVLLFTFVFGGAIPTPGVDYVDYLIPGIFVQIVAFAAVQTGVGLAEDFQGGMIDRFRSLPMARSAVLAGRTLSDVARNLVVVALMTAVGLLVGFNFQNGLLPALAGIALLLFFGFAMSWIGATIGLAVKNAEATQAASFVWMFPLIFASAIFVPVDAMRGAWLQAFARNSPITLTVDALRALFLGGPVTDSLVPAVAWMVGTLAVFVPLAVARYRRAG